MKTKKLYQRIISFIEPILRMHHTDIHNEIDLLHKHIDEVHFNIIEMIGQLESKMEKKIDEEMSRLRSDNIITGKYPVNQGPLSRWATEELERLKREDMSVSEKGGMHQSINQHLNSNWYDEIWE